MPYDLCIRDLSAVAGGALRLGSMPPLGGDLEPISRIVVQVQDVQKGDVFWALGGTENAYEAELAYARGAIGVVVSGRCVEPWAGAFSLEVADTRWALWKLATWNRQRFEGRLIALTGGASSIVGGILEDVLASQLTGCRPTPNADGETNLLLSLIEIEPHAEFAILELTGNTTGDIKAVSDLCRPHIAVVLGAVEQDKSTNIAHAGDCAVIHSLGDDGWAVLNGDDPRQRKITTDTTACIVWTGRSPDNDVIATHVASGGGKLSFTVDSQPFELNVWGRHYLPPALCGLAVGRLMGIDEQQIAASLKKYEPAAATCQVINTGRWVIINDCGAANFVSLNAGLKLLREMKASRRIVVCGDLEQGAGDANQVGEEMVTTCGADHLTACGGDASAIIAAAQNAGMPKQRTIAFDHAADAAEQLAADLKDGDVVLVKGRRTEEMQAVVQALANAATPSNNSTAVIAPLFSPFTVSPSGSVLREIDPTLPPG